MELPHKTQCIQCASDTFTVAKYPLCNKCVVEKCDMSDVCDSLNRRKCNNVVDMINRNGKCVCIGHYKVLKMACKTCGEPRSNARADKVYDAYDDWYYCKVHTPDQIEQYNCMCDLLGNHLNGDTLNLIYSKLRS